jgi:dTDP-4-dehydrorhamnose 3,5-epimerase
MSKGLNIFEGLHIIHPSVFNDDRGYFFESFNKKKFIELTGYTNEFVQDNQSLSTINVLRGLHFQMPPYAQAKLVRVVRGSVLDIAVDIRKNSPTFGKYFSLELNDKNNLSLFIPEGFAHGFITLEENTLFIYKCSEFYHKESERTIMWNDVDLKIDWKNSNPLISPKDEEGLIFSKFNSPF